MSAVSSPHRSTRQHQVVPDPAGPVLRVEDPGLATTAAARDVLVVTGDTRLDDAVGKLSALAGRPVCTLRPEAVTGTRWTRASHVVVGADSVAAVADRRLPRREGVLVVGGDPSCVDDPGLLRAALGVGATDVLVLPHGEARLLRCLADGDSPGSAVLLGVVGARGGAGATTLACALGVTGARQGLRVALVDADPLGGGVDLALGTEDAPGARWSQVVGRGVEGRGERLERLLPDLGGLRVLSCDEEFATAPPAGSVARIDLPPEAISSRVITSVLAELRRSRDVVVVDVPRQWSHGVGAGLDLLDAAVLVAPAEVRSTAAAVRVLHRLRNHVDDVRLVVRGPAPGGLTAELVADALGLPLAAELAPEPGLAEAYERGLPPARRASGPLAMCARGLLADVAPPEAATA